MKQELQKHIKKLDQNILNEKIILITPKKDGGTAMTVVRHFDTRTEARREAARLYPSTRIHDATAEHFKI